jgi:hypothetical protein
MVVQVDGDGLFNFHAHQSIHDLFTYMIAAPAGGVSRLFDLNRLLLGQGGAWITNRYNDDGGPNGGYEAVIATVGNQGLVPQSITYIASGSGLTRTVLETDFLGDYNFDDSVNAADYTVWRNTRGSVSDMRADGSGNGVVDPDDLLVWKEHYGETRPETAAASAAWVVASQSASGEKPGPAAVGAFFQAAHLGPLSRPVSTGDMKPPAQRPATAEIGRDVALLAWLALPGIEQRARENRVDEFEPENESDDGKLDSRNESLDAAFDLLAPAI